MSLKLEEIQNELQSLKKLVILHSKKKVLTLEELASYTGLSKSHIYKLTSAMAIPHYKPNGKNIYFNRDEVDNWLLQRKKTTRQDIEEEAANLVALNQS